MGSPDGDGERIDVGFGDELLGLVRIGQVPLRLFLAETGPVPVLDPTERPDLPLDADALGVSGGDDLPGDLNVVLEAARGLSIRLQ